VFLAFGFHVPLNVLSMLGGRGLEVIIRMLFSVLNLACVGLALWRIGQFLSSLKREVIGRRG
jgi:hypothetical protein